MWTAVASDSDFQLANIPFGLFSTRDNATKRAATRLGDYVIDLAALAAAGLLQEAGEAVVVALQKVSNSVKALG